MNDKIKELVKRADIDITDFENCPVELYGAEQQLEKFAELIIEECGRALHPMLRDQISRGHAVDLINKHFEVNE